MGEIIDKEGFGVDDKDFAKIIAKGSLMVSSVSKKYTRALAGIQSDVELKKALRPSIASQAL